MATTINYEGFEVVLARQAGAMYVPTLIKDTAILQRQDLSSKQ